jgi:hypothetical protein
MMRSAHVLYRALTIPVEPIMGTDGVLILAPRCEWIEEMALGAVSAYLVLVFSVVMAVGS